ncbi:DUF7033 domain-containing protein [Altibacter sp. HG106]|uniref:DUF7033 domain-containing protein n=1 Tax=Altibacter sp. HG106 TaxID=3023937 RepID=UPI0023507D6C|nr:hypothetical protein [Altibacter sp. HG106]MDC7995974.1 hypothetical protein [Altibacter sp. HG106]
MLLVYTQKCTPRIDYVFKHICTRILGVKVDFTSTIEAFIAHTGPKMSYGKHPIGNELFVQSIGLLQQQGIESTEIHVKEWEGVKAFFAVGEKSALPFDIFAAGFFLLSRYEEYLPQVKDEWGRYPAQESLGFKEEFLEWPVIDLWAQRLKEVLLRQFPDMQFVDKAFAEHHVINARVPYQYANRGLFRSLIGYAYDLWRFRMTPLLRRSQVLFNLRKDAFDTFTFAIDTLKKSKQPLAFFFLLGESAHFNENIDTKRQRFRSLIKYVADYKEVGVMFSHDSLSEYEFMKREKRTMEAITNRKVSATMNDYFAVSLPEAYRHLIELEVTRDYTMVYPETPGFRAGTCTPFLFYDLDYEIKTPLIIQPIAATTKAFKSLKLSEIEPYLNRLQHRVKEVNGTFTLIFSNTDFAEVGSTFWRRYFQQAHSK